MARRFSKKASVLIGDQRDAITVRDSSTQSALQMESLTTTTVI
jgi:hypothetical protein